ncbi:hypothetical protein HALLA_16285 [Halostagnicola larsenii XH-48]|uniref:Uncharacterized protein n=1 Tax=Halostagnicola larsenii XH-48 TaxID=797299 RepID=W0JR60_9EURY|nr:hypothetical protein HALLA_16285 [Halostagnicola larsenii XH-48]
MSARHPRLEYVRATSKSSRFEIRNSISRIVLFRGAYYDVRTSDEQDQ